MSGRANKIDLVFVPNVRHHIGMSAKIMVNQLPFLAKRNLKLDLKIRLRKIDGGDGNIIPAVIA